MTESEPRNAVIRMQDYIHRNIDDVLIIDGVCAQSGYSKRHALRLFKSLLNKTVCEYIRDLRLAMSTGKLVDSGSSERILDIALDAGYESHEGFTKAFCSRFGVLPNSFRKRCLPAAYTAPTPMSYYYLLLRSKGMMTMNQARTVTATFITKPARKLIIRRGILSTDYFSYCDEIGCDIWGTLDKLPNRMDQVSFVILPDYLIQEGTSKVGCAAEVPLDYLSPVPDCCEIIHLEEHPMLWFQGAPYEDEDWYGGAHSEIANAIRNYKPELYGYRFAYDLAPEFHYGASAKGGCRQLVPVAVMAK